MIADITIKKVPSFGTAKRVLQENVALLNDRQLVTILAKATAINAAYNRNLWTDDYYAGVCDHRASGKVPRDMWLLANIRTAIDEARMEIRRRNLSDFFITIEFN